MSACQLNQFAIYQEKKKLYAFEVAIISYMEGAIFVSV